MGTPENLPEDEFIALYTTKGPQWMEDNGHGNGRNIMRRRRKLEVKFKRPISAPAPKNSHNAKFNYIEHSHRIPIDVKDGVVLVGSDLHIWPGDNSSTFRAFVKFADEMDPAAIVMNGDVFDGASISRHPPIGWATQPTVVDEIEAGKDALAKIEATKRRRRMKLIWSLGNHDSRFETRLATVAPQYANVHGLSLHDHFPAWQSCWSCWINGDSADGVVVKHRFKGGLYAPANNTLWAGRSMVTGHLHSAKVLPITDYNGTRFGIDTGCLADTSGRQFTDYTEDAPKNWVSAFAVLTFRDGKLLWPELVVRVDDEKVQFRGSLIRV